MQSCDSHTGSFMPCLMMILIRWSQLNIRRLHPQQFFRAVSLQSALIYAHTYSIVNGEFVSAVQHRKINHTFIAFYDT